MATPHNPAAKARRRNLSFYNDLWRSAHLISPTKFNTWPHLEHLNTPDTPRLELGPGLRPRLPISGTHFVDLSRPALDKLAKAGGHICAGTVEQLPFDDHTFDAIAAFDVIEHTADDHATLHELARVARPGAELWLSVPLHASQWRAFDDIVGHCRRYSADELHALAAATGFHIEASAAFGMKPSHPQLVDWGMRYLARHPRRAMWCYNQLFMLIGLHRQKPLQLHTGLITTEAISEVLLRCRIH
ncbi:class I SAM-dependent methyltransferase [Salinisphaera sp. USBA-960]|uniref:class I SAM-dependent methyltransferase n=1 Tax=Salinisphaera orenii TaxID=856731 RepID=UPI000DBE2894|nr:class I SAM-dependent methyltransferase [Salifodinibacter halophilus]NNC25737.1 class I SAM-dependent methyltransferase [Salifodinibacter halophilus]